MSKPEGFRNMGATCWLNSLSQAILSLDCLSKYYNTLKPESILKNRYIPIKFFMGQQSASEGLVFLLAHKKLEEEIERFFKMRIRTQITCQDCKYCREISDYRIHATIFNEDALKNEGIVSALRSQKENLKDYKCEKCKSNKIEKCESLRKAPKVITIIFNRYKIRNLLDYPDDFKMSKHDYKLKSQVIHMGSLNGGHYVAQGMRKSRIYCFDDSSFNEISKFTKNGNVYMVFYECSCPNH